MTPESFFICRFAAEPPQLALPAGEWAATLQKEFSAAFTRIEAPGVELGELGDVTWYPDRSWNGRTYVPATMRTTTGLEVYGYVSFIAADSSDEGIEPAEFRGWADFAEETADGHPEWKIDICDEVLGSWNGEAGASADMTLVWGRSLVSGATATAQLDEATVDQCTLADDRFTLIAPDAYRGSYLKIAIYSASGQQLAAQSLYEDETTQLTAARQS